MKKFSILQLFISLFLLVMITSCTTSRIITSTTLRPFATQKTKWVNGEEIVYDSSIKVYGDINVKSSNTSAQFLLHLVNKSDQPVLIDPALIQCIQNKGDVNEKVVNNQAYYAATRTPSSEENKSNQTEVKTAVAIGVAALLIGGIIYTASRNAKNNSDNSHAEHQRTPSHAHSHYHNTNCRCSSCHTYASIDDSKTYKSEPAYQPPAPAFLKKHTLFPGEEYSGIMSFELPNGVKNIEIRIPLNSGQGMLRYQMEVVRVTY